MATIERIPVKPVEEVLMSLTPEEATVLKKVIGCVSVANNHNRRIIIDIYDRLGKIGINFSFGECLPYTELRG